MIQNPILPGCNPDPSICRVDNDFYLATSTFEWFPGLPIYHSRDLVHWRLLTHVLDETRLLNLRGVPSSGGVWAPALSFQDGRFYLCYTIVHQHQAATKDTPNFLITSDSIEGPWSDPVSVNASGFDPSLFHDDDGTKYWLNMVWDHRPNRHPFYGISLQRFDEQHRRLAGESRIIFKGTSIGLTEGPHLYKRRGWYFLLTAEGGTEYDHCVSLARSRNIWGPYEVHPQNPVMTSANHPDNPLQKAGHASLVETATGQWYMPHLCGRPIPGTRRCNLGRETAIQQVQWRDDDWLYLVGDDNQPKEFVPTPQLPAQPWPELPSRLPFDSIHYSTPRLPSSGVIRDPEKLCLAGAESLESCFEQSMLARRLTSQRMTITTKISFEPSTFQQMSGLVAYYNTFLFHYLYLSHDEQKGRCLQIHSCHDGTSVFPLQSDEIVVPDGDLLLRATFDDDQLSFSWSTDEVTFQEAGPVLDASILSDEFGERWGFTGTFIGLACQDLSGARCPASFDFLEFLPQRPSEGL